MLCTLELCNLRSDKYFVSFDVKLDLFFQLIKLFSVLHLVELICIRDSYFLIENDHLSYDSLGDNENVKSSDQTLMHIYQNTPF